MHPGPSATTSVERLNPKIVVAVTAESKPAFADAPVTAEFKPSFKPKTTDLKTVTSKPNTPELKPIPVAVVDSKKPGSVKATAPTVRPNCVKKPGEDCSCGDTGCDGPPEFVPSAESETVCSSHDVFRKKGSISEARAVARSVDACVPKSEPPKFCGDVNEKKTRSDENFQVPLLTLPF